MNTSAMGSLIVILQVMKSPLSVTIAPSLDLLCARMAASVLQKTIYATEKLTVLMDLTNLTLGPTAPFVHKMEAYHAQAFLEVVPYFVTEIPHVPILGMNCFQLAKLIKFYVLEKAFTPVKMDPYVFMSQSCVILSGIVTVGRMRNPMFAKVSVIFTALKETLFSLVITAASEAYLVAVPKRNLFVRTKGI